MMLLNECPNTLKLKRYGGRKSTDQRKLLVIAVKINGAVSPAARATASITPVRIPDFAFGSVTFQITWALVAAHPNGCILHLLRHHLDGFFGGEHDRRDHQDRQCAAPANAENPVRSTTQHRQRRRPGWMEAQ